MSEMNKKVVVIGNGGREHALVWKLSQSDKINEIFVLNGTVGIERIPKVQIITDVNSESRMLWYKKHNIDLVVIGPEAPLAEGICDDLRQHKILCFGPSKDGAEIETNKEWSKNFMIRYNIPTAKFQSFTNATKAKEFIRTANYEALVVKASGLAAGKGVIVASNREEACEAVDQILENKTFGKAGDVIVVEEKLDGEEVSCLAFMDSTSFRVMLPAQDHKRIGNNDVGPNTGGMGAYCPCNLINEKEMDIVKDVMQKCIDGFRKENIEYCGVLYAGIMLTPNGPKVLEFNCRFGDPETQVILPLLENDLFDVMTACAQNKLSTVELKWKENTCAVGVVMASKGYPETSTKGCVINGMDKVAKMENHLIFHSGIATNKNCEFVTNGGRVLTNVVLSSDLKAAAELATKACEMITFDGAQFRTDIAAKGYKQMLTYKLSGVNIDAGEDLVQRIKPLARGTYRPGVIGGLGGFGGLFRLNDVTYKNIDHKEVNYTDPVLVEATGGCGTKLKIALEIGSYDTIGIDLVAICANDVLCTGAEPIAFLDYIACGRLDVPVAAQFVKGISEGCREINCALLGGETAEMPALYEPGKYDLAGYCVGIVENNNILPKLNDISPGDIVIGLPSNGLHNNGFNEILALMDLIGTKLTDKAPFSAKGLTYGQEFLKPSTLYFNQVMPLIRKGFIKAAAHIANGGLIECFSKILPSAMGVQLDGNSFEIPEIFGWISAKCNIASEEMLKTFNCGIGMVLIVSESIKLQEKLISTSYLMGHVVKNSLLTKPVQMKNFDEALTKISEKYSKTTGKKVSIQSSCSDSIITLTNEINLFTKSTYYPGVISEPGNSTGLFRLKDLTRIDRDGNLKSYEDPILVLGTDGVGTKLKIAQSINNNKTIGIDLVAMCANDIICTGAAPITFLDYYACGKLDETIASDVISGISEGCYQSKCSLIRSEISEMPVIYENKEYDLAGFSMGVVEKRCILPRIDTIKEGDILIGLPSTGIHSNGFSLVHKILKKCRLTYDCKAPFSSNYRTIGEELLVPTKIYVTALESILNSGLVKAIAHITGGGILENIPRVLPDHLGVLIDSHKFNIPPIFGWIAKEANLSDYEMLRTFNCGIGLVIIVPADSEKEAISSLYGYDHSVIGKVIKRNQTDLQVKVENFTKNISLLCVNLSLRVCKRVGVLISGNGSNLQALIDATRNTSMGLFSEIVCVISNKANAYGLERAKKANISGTVISHKDYPNREQFDDEINKEFNKHNVQIICLAGFMRILSEKFVKIWKGRLLNIHPSLLPKYKGMHAQKQALDSNDDISGCTVHFVDETVDTGATILQEIVPITETDTEDSLTEKIHKAEHIAYPKALRLLATGKVILSSNGDILWNK